jgi:nucleoside-diphosphate-sugar epimerase
MKVLFIGGTGTISAAISRRVSALGWDLYLLNRGGRNDALGAAGKYTEIRCDIRAGDEETIIEKLKACLGSEERFDATADFIAFSREHVEKDYRILKDLTRQHFFISSASAYQKPPVDYKISESTPLANPLWKYSRDKIACENFLMEKYREEGFPVTIIRPSHTYDERKVPLGVQSPKGSWPVIKRIIEGRPVIIHGDGTSLWTMTSSRDFAPAFTGLMGNIHAIGQAVQITSDETLTWNQIYAAIAAALDKPLRAVHVSSEFLAAAGTYDFEGSLTGDKANSAVFDNAKLKRLVPGFTASIRFDQGVRETLAFILSHKECQEEDPEFDAWCDRVIAAREKALAEMRAGK